jgi:hypothetical protein
MQNSGINHFIEAGKRAGAWHAKYLKEITFFDVK